MRWWVTLGVCLGSISGLSGDWAHWRGPLQNGSSDAAALPASWSPEGENLVWKAPYGTRSTPIVANGRVYMINAAGQGDRLQERVVALDFATGELVWEHRFNVFLTDIVAHRLGWANPCADPETGNIYAHGVQGLFFCFDKDGKVLWERSLTEEFGRISGYGGRTHSPIIYGDLVIISFLNSSWGPQGKGQHRYLAMDKLSGDVVWWTAADGNPLDTTYSTPVIATINDTDLMIAGAADGTIRAFKAATGEPVWSFSLSKRGINVSVLVHDGLVYASHSEENMDTSVMGRLVCIDANGSGDVTSTHEKWRIDGLGAGYSSPTMGDGMLLVCDNAANLHAIEPKTGKMFWKFNYGNAAKGSPVYADGKVYVGEEAGKFHVLKVSKMACERLDQDGFELENGSPIEISGSAAIVDGRVLLPTKTDIYCIGGDKPQKTASSRSLVSPGKAGEATFLNAVPAEVVLRPGSKQSFKLSAYDKHGRLVNHPQGTWVLKGLPGSVEGNVYTTPADAGMSAGVATVKAGELEASVRVRIMPDLPYSEDFESLEPGSVPAGWITSKLKVQVMEQDGKKVLRKLADRPSPPFARLRCYMMPPVTGPYTVQADMSGNKKKRFYPDMGLINARYMLRLLGTTRKPTLRLVTWDPIPRLQVDVPFDWQPGSWYTAKLQVEIQEDGRGLVRGKVWTQGESEPESWTIEMMDPVPNTEGSPGLYAYSVGISDTSPGTEVFFDNVSVYRNQ